MTEKKETKEAKVPVQETPWCLFHRFFEMAMMAFPTTNNDHGSFFENELGCFEGGSQGTSRQGWLGDLLIAWLPCVP